MARRDSSNDVPPFLGQQFPVYPDLPQLVRRTFAAPIAVGSPPVTIYPAFVQQWTPPLILRDREQCYLWEPNGVPLETGIYDARLVGSHGGLPLYATTCCPAASVPPSSSIMPGCHLTRPAGTMVYGVPPASYDGLFIREDEILVVVYYMVGAGVSGETLQAFFSGVHGGGLNPMNLEYTFDFPATGSIEGKCAVFTWLGFDQGRATFGFTPGNHFAVAIGIFMTIVRGLPSRVVDQVISATGSGTPPDTGLLAATSQDCEYAQASFGMVNPDVTFAEDWAWDLPFVKGGEGDLGEGYIGYIQGYPSTQRFGITEGYQFLPTVASAQGTVSGVTPETWGGVLVALK